MPGSYKQTLLASFFQGPKDAKVLGSSASSPMVHPAKVIPQPSHNNMVEEDKELNLPAWTTLEVVSESEESVDELPEPSSSRIQESRPLKPKRPLLPKRRAQKTPHDDPMITMSRPKVRQASSRTPGVDSASKSSKDGTEPPSLQEVLQATFNNNGSFNISPSPSPPAAIPTNSEGSCADLIAPPRKRRLVPVVEIVLKRSSIKQSDVVLDASLTNVITGTTVPKAASQKVAPISYESAQDAIDAALDTRVAGITWCTPSYAPRITTPAQRVPFEDATLNFDDDLQEDDFHGECHFLPLKLMRMLDRVQPAAVPQQSSGERFNERLYAMFGETNRLHSPTPEGSDRATADPTPAFTLTHEPTAGKAPRPVSSSGSTTSNTSLAQNTEVTSVTSDHHDVSESKKRSYTESHLEGEPTRKKQKVEVGEDRILRWVAILQRLVKGKIKINQKGMNYLNLMLNEIEKVYPDMDSKLAWVSSLQDVLKQVAQLDHIPFKDEHHLRRRAKDILAEWPLGES